MDLPKTSRLASVRSTSRELFPGTMYSPDSTYPRLPGKG